MTGQNTSGRRPTGPRYLEDDEWRTIVSSVPIVSVDLVILTSEGVVLAKRTNNPAKGEWFVPGGRIHKGERLREAVHRVADEELGIEVSIEQSLGAYEHLYTTAELDDVGGKHYVAHGYVVRATPDEFELDEQHEAVDTFTQLPDDLHEYTRAYLRDAGVL